MQGETEEYISSSQKVVNKTDRGCLIFLGFIVLIVASAYLLNILGASEEKSVLILFSIISFAFFLFGLICLIYIAPRSIIKNSNKSNIKISYLIIILCIIAGLTWWIYKPIINYLEYSEFSLTYAQVGQGGIKFIVTSAVMFLLYSFTCNRNKK